jgi:hypothetical protein
MFPLLAVCLADVEQAALAKDKAGRRHHVLPSPAVEHQPSGGHARHLRRRSGSDHDLRSI